MIIGSDALDKFQFTKQNLPIAPLFKKKYLHLQ